MTKLIILVLGINFIIVSILCCFQFLGIIGTVIYSVILFVLLNKMSKKLKQQYDSILKATDQMAKGVQPASLRYQVLNRQNGMSRVKIQLETGRTHQIRVQFSSRNMPLVGERKYSTLEDPCEIALWSYRLAFTHPVTGKSMEFQLEPPDIYPWTDC